MPRVTLKQIREGIKEGTTLFFVHASWCPYTVQFYPIFDKVMSNLKTKGINEKFNVIKLDDIMTRSIRANYGDIYKKLADYDSNIDEHKLYFPTVVMFVDGKRFKYQVDVRTVQNFEAFIMSKLNKAVNRNRKGTRKDSKTEVKVKKEREDIEQQVRVRIANHNRTSTRPVKFLTLEQQIDKAFRKLLK
jgi:thiol-disulfide isomerase/thioredoxin